MRAEKESCSTSKLTVVVSSFFELSMVIILAGIRGVVGRERVTTVRGSSNGKAVADKPAGQTGVSVVSLLLKSVESEKWDWFLFRGATTSSIM